MRFPRALTALLVLPALVACSDTGEVADVVYTNGRIYTVDESRPWAEAVAIKDGRFLVVGSVADADAVTGSGTEVVDLEGAFAMPGLIDIHTHPSSSMLFRVFCELPGTFYEPTEEQTIAALKQCIETYPDDQEWFIAEGYSSPVMSPESLTAEFLDTLIPHRPAYIKDESGHFAWTNSKGLQALGIDRDTPDRPEGFFSRKPNGDPAGQIFEAAMNPFEEAILPLPPEISRLAKTKLLRQAAEQGITATGDAYVFERDLADWQHLKRNDEIDLHLTLFLSGNFGTAELTPVSDLLRAHEQYELPGPLGVKMSMGGALESRTEVMLDNGYRDGSQVEPLIPAEAFAAYVRELDDAGIQIKVHAIGDGTVRATLDGFEAVIRSRGSNDLRHHIDHCTYVHPDDMPRLAELDVGATAWPMLGAPIGFIRNQAEIVTAEKYHDIAPHRDLLDAGVRMANHSDAPQANLWPWWGMEATITRGFPGRPEIPRLPEHQAITLEETIRVHTINGAWILRIDGETGSIEAGKWADMIVLDRDPFEIEPTGIHETKVNLTLFKGRVVHER